MRPRSRRRLPRSRGSKPGPWTPRGSRDHGVLAGVGPDAPGAFADRILPNAPNPFNPRTVIRFTTGSGTAGPVTLEILNAEGKRVATLLSAWDDGRGSARTVTWDGLDRLKRPV